MDIRIGIVGAGNRGCHSFGRIISEREDTCVVAFADPNAKRAQGAAELLGIEANIYTDTESMLAVETLDGVVIASPDHTHEACALAAIASGLHNLIDKPLASTTSGCLNIIRAARERGVELFVGFNMRHAPLLRRIKEVIEAGDIGNLMLIETREFYDGGRSYMCRWNRRYEWSGGLWVHKGSHDFDLLNWFNAGGEPVRVSAFAGVNALRPDAVPFDLEPGKPLGPNCTVCAYREKCPDMYEVEPRLFSEETAAADGYYKDLCMYTSDKDTHDNGIAIVEYDNNVRASLLQCFVANFSDRLYTITGDRGTIMAALKTPTQIEVRPRWGEENRIIKVPPAGGGGHGGADPRLVDCFVDSIRSGASYGSNLADGIRAVAIGEAAERSWREHRMVEISELVDLRDAGSV